MKIDFSIKTNMKNLGKNKRNFKKPGNASKMSTVGSKMPPSEGRQETREPEPETETVIHMNRNQYEPKLV